MFFGGSKRRKNPPVGKKKKRLVFFVVLEGSCQGDYPPPELLFGGVEKGSGASLGLVWDRVWGVAPQPPNPAQNSRNHIPKASLKPLLNQPHTQHNSAPNQPKPTQSQP